MAAWLRCRVQNGLFSDESIITVQQAGSGPVVFVVPRKKVRGNGVDGAVQVSVYRRDDGPWVVLPTSYRDTVPIEDADFDYTEQAPKCRD